MSEEVEVTWEDQKKINDFGRLNNKMQELNSELLVKRTHLEDLEEAEGETIMGSEETVRMRVGEIFIHVTPDEAGQILNNQMDIARDEINLLNNEVESIKKKLADLKVSLYQKFGNQINLEEVSK